jgi:hypothetical protein
VFILILLLFQLFRLKKRLSSDYGFDVSLKYEDKDGDIILLASQNDLNDLFLYGESDTINAIVSETISLPNVHLKGIGSNTSRAGTAGGAVGMSSAFSPLLSAASTTLGGTINLAGFTMNNNTAAYSTTSGLTLSSPRPSLLGASTPVPASTLLLGSTAPPASTSGSAAATAATASLKPVQGTRLDRFPSISDGTSQNRQQEIFNIRWKKGEILGQGAFGVVYLGLNSDTGELMAVKQMATDDVSKRELSSLENEIHLLRNLRHPNIVRYIGTELNPESMSIFLEYVPGGSLKALIDKFGQLEESVAKSYTRQLLIGLEYLHRHGIAHRDIKGANCLVGNDGVIKLADFGNSKHWRPPGATASLRPAEVGALQQHQAAAQASSGDIKGDYFPYSFHHSIEPATATAASIAIVIVVAASRVDKLIVFCLYVSVCICVCLSVPCLLACLLACPQEPPRGWRPR